MAVAGLAAQAMSGGMTMDQVMNFVPISPVQDNVVHFNRIMLTLRAYFAVDNEYVKRKMKKVLFPFTSKQWRRMVRKPLMLFLFIHLQKERHPHNGFSVSMSFMTKIECRGS